MVGATEALHSTTSLQKAAADSGANAAPTKEEINTYRAIQKKLQAQPYAMPSEQYGNVLNPEAGKNTQRANQFPSVPYPKDPEDDVMAAKKQFMDRNPGVVPQLTVGDRDIDFIQKKQRAAEYYNYSEWAAQQFDLRDPAQARLFAKIKPDYYKKRELLIDDVGDLMKQYAKIRLRGIQSESDLELMWAIETGKIPFLQKPGLTLWEPSTWMNVQGGGTKPENSGIYNPLGWVSGGQPKRPTDNYSDPLGTASLGDAQQKMYLHQGDKRWFPAEGLYTNSIFSGIKGEGN